jgi:hypothetical protein
MTLNEAKKILSVNNHVISNNGGNVGRSICKVGFMGLAQRAHLVSVWAQGRLFAEQVLVGQECAPVECGPSHQRQQKGYSHLVVWWPNLWHLAHWVEGRKRNLRSALRVAENAKRRGQEATSWALSPESEITTEEARFSFRCLGLESQRGGEANTRPGL